MEIRWRGRLGFPAERGEIPLKGEEFSAGRDVREVERDFREGAARLVRETGKLFAQVARDLAMTWPVRGIRRTAASWTSC